MTWALRAPRLDPVLPARPRRSASSDRRAAGPRARRTRAAAPARAAAVAWPRCVPSLGASWAHPGTRLGLLDALLDAVQRDRARPAVGLPVLRARRGPLRAPPALLLTLMVGGDGRRTGARLADHRPAVAPLDAGARHRRAIVAVWTVVLAWPGNAPLLAAGAAGRGHGRRRPGVDDRLRPRAYVQPAAPAGAATGIINQGGFYASLILVVAVGLILDWRTPGRRGRLHPAEAFRWAMSFQYLLWGSAWSRSGATAAGPAAWSAGTS